MGSLAVASNCRNAEIARERGGKVEIAVAGRGVTTERERDEMGEHGFGEG